MHINELQYPMIWAQLEDRLLLEIGLIPIDWDGPEGERVCLGQIDVGIFKCFGGVTLGKVSRFDATLRSPITAHIDIWGPNTNPLFDISGETKLASLNFHSAYDADMCKWAYRDRIFPPDFRIEDARGPNWYAECIVDSEHWSMDASLLVQLKLLLGE
jgi:hypothetical protein